MNHLLVQAPSSDWDPDGSESPGVQQAISDIGFFVPQLGSDPRSAYATSIKTADDASHAWQAVDGANIDKVKAASPRKNPDYSAAEFDAAKGVLKDELTKVENVRDYLAKLAEPAAAAGHAAWEDASILQNRLSKELEYYDKDASMRFDPFGAIKALLDFAGASFGAEGIEKYISKAIKAAAGLDDTAKFFFDGNYDGSSDIDKDPRIQADELAKQLEAQARGTTFAYARMGDVIVSDPVKLEEAGAQANCKQPCKPGYEEYSTDQIEYVGAMAGRSLDRTIYEHLLPPSFQVWDTTENGLTVVPGNPKEWFEAGALYDCRPFSGAPPLSSTWMLENWVPGDVPGPSKLEGDVFNQFRVYVITYRSGLYYYWPEPTILNRMFGAVTHSDDTNPDADSLGIDIVEYMRTAGPPRYHSGVTCEWGI